MSLETETMEPGSLTLEHRNQIEHAFAYVQRGWSLVMMPMKTKGPNHPGWNAPSELVDTPDRVVKKLSQGLQNMGLVHQPSGTGALDIDDEAWARHIFEEFGFDYDEIMDVGLRIYSKANRDKAIFAGVPEDLPLLKVTWPKPDAKLPTDRFTIIEFRAGPNQDVLPPSMHPDGHYYTWAEGKAPWDFEELPQIPEKLLQFWRALADKSSGLREEIENLCPWKKMHVGKRYVQAARTVTPENNDIIGKYNRAVDLEDLLARSGYKKMGKRWLAPSSSTRIPGVVVFKDQDHVRCYSHHGSDPLADRAAHDAFDVLTILYHNGDVKQALDEAAKVAGVDRHPPKHQPEVTIDLDAALAKQEERKQRAAEQERATPAPALAQRGPATAAKAAEEVTYDVPDYPAYLLKPGGVVQSITDWILQTAQKPQPILALAAALSVVGLVLGRKVATTTGLRTNYYLVGVAGTSAGKDHARKCIKVLFQSAGLSDMLGGEELASGPALLARAADHPVSLFQIDEFGLMLKAVAQKGAGPHLASIVTNLMKLFSSAGTIYNGTEYADRKMKERRDIAYPCVGLHGTTTPETLWPALGSQDVVSGYLNRMILMFAPDRRIPKNFDTGIGQPPEEVIEWMKSARELQCGILGLDPASPMELKFAGMAGQIMRDFDEWVENRQEETKSSGLAPLWGRAWEHAAKFALGMACARYDAATLKQVASGGGLEIDPTSAQWAVDFVKFALSIQQEQVATRMGDSDFDRWCQEVSRVLRQAGPSGRTEAELTKYSRMYRSLEPRQQDSIIDALKRREEITLVQFKPFMGRGRSRMAWVANEFVEQPEEPEGEVS